MFKSYYPGLNYKTSIGPILFLYHIVEWTLLISMLILRRRLSTKASQTEKDKPTIWYLTIVCMAIAAGFAVYFDVRIALDSFRQRHVVDQHAPVALVRSVMLFMLR